MRGYTVKKIFSTIDPVTIGYYKTILDNLGIKCVLKNYYLAGAAGELPINTCWPELWVLDDSQAAEASAILKEINKPAIGNEWLCPQCQEANETQFGVCWHCGSSFR